MGAKTLLGFHHERKSPLYVPKRTSLCSVLEDLMMGGRVTTVLAIKGHLVWEATDKQKMTMEVKSNFYLSDQKAKFHIKLLHKECILFY